MNSVSTHSDNFVEIIETYPSFPSSNSGNAFEVHLTQISGIFNHDSLNFYDHY